MPFRHDGSYAPWTATEVAELRRLFGDEGASRRIQADQQEEAVRAMQREIAAQRAAPVPQDLAQDAFSNATWIREAPLPQRAIRFNNQWANNAAGLPADPTPVDPTPALKCVNRFLIGCDPEFIVLDPPKKLVPVNGYVTQRGSIGWDHNGRVAELRPEPAKNVVTVLERISRLLQAPELKPISKKRFRAGAAFEHADGIELLGGHIHLDIPFESPEAQLALPALDQVTTWLERLDILPMRESSIRRQRGPYGNFADVREHSGHLEYRTMASWLFSPRVAMLALTGAKLAGVFPRQVYQFLASRTPSLQGLEQLFYQHRGQDKDSDISLQIVQHAVAQDVEGDFKGSWLKFSDAIPT